MFIFKENENLKVIMNLLSKTMMLIHVFGHLDKINFPLITLLFGLNA
jgi:hypothetical protein